LHNNNLTTLPMDIFEPLDRLRQLRLAENPLVCDCRLGWLAPWLRRNPTLALFAKCASPYHLLGKAITELHDSQFVCNGESLISCREP
jgi:hypothetical protein